MNYKRTEMKKTSKIYLSLWVCVILLFAIVVWGGCAGLFSPHHRLAQDPTNIDRITGLDLPDVISVESWDNLERSSSRWDCFNHRSCFADELSDDCIHQLETLCQTDSAHWHKNDSVGFYEYSDEAWWDGGYCIHCLIYEDSSFVEYYVDEDEGLEVLIFGFPIILSLSFVLIVWGIVLLVMAIVRKYKKRKK
jgi:hypothetical protein